MAGHIGDTCNLADFDLSVEFYPSGISVVGDNVPGGWLDSAQGDRRAVFFRYVRLGRLNIVRNEAAERPQSQPLARKLVHGEIRPPPDFDLIIHGRTAGAFTSMPFFFAKERSASRAT